MEFSTQKRLLWFRSLTATMFALALAGCTHLPVEPARVSMTVALDVARSGYVPGEVVMSVELRNNSTRTLRFAVDGESGRPFYLNWLNYKILKSSPTGFVEDIGRVPFDDGVVSFTTLSIGPGDASTLLFSFKNAIKEDCSKRFVVELEDKSSNLFRSEPFRPCDAAGTGE